MRDGQNINEQVWDSTTDLATAANRILATNEVAGAAGAVDCMYRPYLRFGLFADQVLTLTIEVSLDDLTYTVDQTLVTVASTWFHAYDLPAPRGANGYYVVDANYVQLRIANASGTDTTVLYFHAAIRNTL